MKQSNSQVLKLAVEQAIRGGWDCFGLAKQKDFYVLELDESIGREVGIELGYRSRKYGEDVHFLSWQEIFFDPGWAKGFVGEQLVLTGYDYEKKQPVLTHFWKYFQHQLLDEIQAGRDPFKFVGRFLKKGEKK